MTVPPGRIGGLLHLENGKARFKKISRIPRGLGRFLRIGAMEVTFLAGAASRKKYSVDSDFCLDSVLRCSYSSPRQEMGFFSPLLPSPRRPKSHFSGFPT